MTVIQKLGRPLRIAKWVVKKPWPTMRSGGPFALFDKRAKPVGFFKTYEEAEAELRDKHHMGGTIFDVTTHTNVSPQERLRSRLAHFVKFKPLVEHPDFSGGNSGGKQPGGGSTLAHSGPPMPGRMDSGTSEFVQSLSAMSGATIGELLVRPDHELIARFIEQINNLPGIPVIDYFNKLNPDLTKEVIIQVPKTITKYRSIVVQKDVVKVVEGTERQEVQFPTDDAVSRPIRGFSEINRLDPSILALPVEVWAKRVVEREIQVNDYYEQVPVPKEVVVQEPRTVQEPYEETIMVPKKVRVPDEKKGQVLYILMDWSPSTYTSGGFDCDPRRLPAEIALASVVVGCHLADGSRYLYRPFTQSLGSRIEAHDSAGKMGLITHFAEPQLLEGGTEILKAVRVAASEIRDLVQTADDVPEVLLMTDGQGVEDSAAIRAALAGDVILHTVIFNGSNQSLRSCSKTYIELWADARNNLRIQH